MLAVDARDAARYDDEGEATTLHLQGFFLWLLKETRKSELTKKHGVGDFCNGREMQDNRLQEVYDWVRPEFAVRVILSGYFQDARYRVG
jgi:hypothetical protein